MTLAPRLSLVIPLYNEAQRFERLAQALVEFGRLAGGLSFEVILVNDGSRDDTPRLMEGLKRELETGQAAGGGLAGVRLIHLPQNQGKGRALLAGVRAAGGDWVLTLDADMACPPTQLLEWQERGFIDLAAPPDPGQVYYGCREHAQSQVHDLTYRRYMGKVFNTLVQLICEVPLKDTQCGFKLYPRATAQGCFALVANWGWAHDVEISKVLYQQGYRIAPLPIAWSAIAGSKIRPLADAAGMFAELFKIEMSFILRFGLGLGRPRPAPDQGLVYRRLSLIMGLVLLAVVLATFGDYGLTNQEPAQAGYGQAVVRYYASLRGDRSVLDLPLASRQGGLFQAAAHLFSQIAPLEQYQARHLLTALAGLLGLAGAWRLAGYLAGAKAAFWAALLLALTPLYYGHIFNSSQEVPLAAAFAWAAYYLARGLAHLPAVPRGLALKLGLCWGLCLGIGPEGAILGLGLVGVPALWLAAQALRRGRAGLAGQAWLLARTWLLPVVLLAYAVLLLAWPWAQQSPLAGLWSALAQAAADGPRQWLLLDGRHYCSLAPPLAQVGQGLIMALPEVLLLALLCAAWAGLGRGIRAEEGTGGDGGRLWPCIGLLALTLSPLLLLALVPVNLPDGPHRLLFLLPLLAAWGGAGLALVMAGLARRWPWARGLLVALLALAAAQQAVTMVRLHPYQYVYFNSLAGGPAGAQGRYDLDYLGLSYAEALARLGRLVQDQGQGRTYHVISLGAQAEVLSYLAKNLPANLLITSDPRQADFHLDFTRWACHQASHGPVLDRVERLGATLSVSKDLRPLAAKTMSSPWRACNTKLRSNE